MSQSSYPVNCPDCGSASRREFLKTAVGGIAAATVVSAGLVVPRQVASAAQVGAAPAVGASGLSETLVGQLYKSLTEQQQKVICFPFDHALRSKVDNNWHIIDQPIAKVFDKDQQALIRDIFVDMHSEEYAPKVLHQVEHDNREIGGFGSCAVALFGKPGDKFEFVFTGRHVTRRCDGNSVEGEAFGGPIFYGHAAKGFNEPADHPGNAYWYQAKRANELFQALDEKQRKIALRNDPREEEGTKTVALRGKADGLPGISVTELTRDQKDLMRKVMSDVLAPFRQTDATKALKLVEDAGFDKLHIAFYSNDDIGNDGVWDLWQIEGPSMVWYFRGAPHVHTWVHVREPDNA